MADAPAGGGAKDPQALIAKHAAITQSGAAGDAAIVSRVEASIKNSPMGWLQGMLGETSSRATAEQGEVHGKLQEHQDLVAKNGKDAPKDAGPPPAPGPATHPAIAQPASAAAKPAVVAHASASGGAAVAHAPIAGAAPAKSPAPSAPAAAPAPTIAAAVASAGSDGQLDGILNGYTPKSPQTTATLGRIKEMGTIAQGFNGQLDVYVSQGGAVDGAIAGTMNFLGAGKDANAIWRNNPYRKVHGVLGGIMTGMSAVKSVCSIVGSICGKLGMVLTVIGLLGMIFPPIGAAVSGIARILSVVGMICDAISFVLSGILTGLNGVVLAQQIAAGASAEEKAASADMMMSEANEAASGFINLAMTFGPKFMKGMLGQSKGVVSSLMRRAKATIGRISLKVSGNVSAFANKMVRKLGFGGAKMARVGGEWKNTGFVAGMKEKVAGSKVGKAFYGAPQHLEAVQEKLMAKYGNTTWAKNMDRVGAWSGSVANRFDIEDKVGKLGEKSGAWVGGLGGDTKLGKSLAASAERSELQTRELAMKFKANDAADLEQTRWRNELNRRQGANPEHVRNQGVEDKFVAGQGDKVRDKAQKDFEHQESQRETKEKLEKLRTARFERRNEQFYDNKIDPATGKSARDSMLGTVHRSRDTRYELEAQLKPQEHERKELLAKATKSADDQTRLTALNSELRPLDEARRQNKMWETDLSALSSGSEHVRKAEYHNWKDVGSNAWEASSPVLEMMDLKDHDSAWASAEKANLRKQVKYNKGSAQANAAGRGGHGTLEEIASDARGRQLEELSAFVRNAPVSPTLSNRVSSMLSPITSRAPAAATAPPPVATTAPTTAPTPAATPGGVSVTPNAEHKPHPVGEAVALTAQVHEPAPTPVPAAVPDKQEEPDGDGAGEPLPYWPALLPEFDLAQRDFGWMRKVAVEFKKAQIEGKQKAVDTLAVYGRYKEYSALRSAAAKKNQEGAAQTGQATAANVGHANQTESQAGQGEAKQGEAKGAAGNKAGTDLPEPESRGFWGRILGAVKRWAKNKAAQVFGWIQEKIASVILKGLCGVSMGDMREYAGALRRQQQAAHGVADDAGKTSGQAATTSIKLGSDATKEAQGAADAIGECDKNIGDADTFMADVASFEMQLAEEKANAQLFIGQVQAAAHAEQARRQAEAAQHAADEAKSAALSGAAPPPAAAANAAPAAEPAHEEAPHPPAPAETSGDVSMLTAASGYVATESGTLTSRLEARADDYTNQLALALTNKTGKDDQGVDLKGPAKQESKHIVEEFKEAAAHTKTDMEAFHNMSLDPSQSKRIADQIIQSAQHLETIYTQSENALDELFARTYNGIKEGRRTWKSRMLDGDNIVGEINHAGDAVEDKVIDRSLPAMTTAWNKISSPIQVHDAPHEAPQPSPIDSPIGAPSGNVMVADEQPKGQVAIASSGPAVPAPKNVPDAVSATLSRAQGSPLPDPEKWGRRVGGDVSFARIVTGEGAPEAAASIGARAFTVGDRVFFARGNDAQTDGGNLLAHELTHVVQQRGGTAPTSWDKTPFVDFHDQREVAARAHDSSAQVPSEHAIARDAEPDINNDTYRKKFGKNIGDGVAQYLQNHDIQSGSRFVTFLGPLAAGPALVGVTGADLDAKLDLWITQDTVMRAIQHGRPKGTETVEYSDGKQAIEDKGQDGPGRWFPDVATELGASLYAAMRTSLDRVVPRYQQAAVALGIAAEQKAQANLQEVPTPKAGDIVASSQLDAAMIQGLVNHGHFDYAGYRRTYPNEKGKLGALRAVELNVEAPKDGMFYARVKSPADATPEEVANQLFGSSTATGELQIVAAPLFGFANASTLKPAYGDKLRAMGVNTNISVVDPAAAAAKGPMADELAKNQGKGIPSKLATRTAILAAIDESSAIVPTIEKSGAAFGMGNNPVVASLAPLKKELGDRKAKIATMSEEDAVAWAGQVEGQQQVLTLVSFSFATHAKRLADLTKMVDDPTMKKFALNLPPYVREAMLVVAMKYADVCVQSGMFATASAKLKLVEDEAGSLPVTFLEGALVAIQRSLDGARDAKHDAGDHGAYDVGGMQGREVQLKERLAALRVQIKSDPEGAAKELQAVSQLIQGLQTETEMVANMDGIDGAWKALDDSVHWYSSGFTHIMGDALKAQGDALHGRWKAIFTNWKSGDPAKQEQAKKDLTALRADPALTDWITQVQKFCKSAAIEKLITEFAILIAITVVTAGVGDLVAAGAAGWELSAGATAVAVGGAEAATFTLLNQVMLEQDHSAGHIGFELATNWAMFGIMRRFQAFAELAELSKGATVTGNMVITTATTFAQAELTKYIQEGKHLDKEDVKKIALQGIAMAIAINAVAPAMKPMFAELEGSTYKFMTELRANNAMRETLTVQAKALQGTKDITKAGEYVSGERAWLEQRIKILGEMEEAMKAEEQPGAKKPPGGGLAAKLKMSPESLGELKTSLTTQLAGMKAAELPLMSLEPKGEGLFTCPKDKIADVVDAIGTVESKSFDKTTTITSYKVKLKDGNVITVMEKLDPTADWVAHLKSELSPDALKKLEVLTKGWTPQQIQDRWHGDTEMAVEELGRGGDVPKSEKDSLDLFGVGEVPADRNARWDYKDDPGHWTPEREGLHKSLHDVAVGQMMEMAEALPQGESTLTAMRGNTASGKTRALNTVPALKPAMDATKGKDFRAINPDPFKPKLMTNGLTSSQVHAESSMLATRVENTMKGATGSNGKPASMMIDKRLASTKDVTDYADMAKTTNRKFVLYDVDAPLESSLIGVLERQPGGNDPLPPFDVVASGFKAIHDNRLPVIQQFTTGAIKGEYYLYGTRANGDRVLIGQVRGNEYVAVDAELSAAALDPAGPIDAIAKQRITEESIERLTTDLGGDRGTMIKNLLRKYIGWTWKDALSAHSRERVPQNKKPADTKIDTPATDTNTNGGTGQ